jgi:hypothetical protein
VGSDWNQNFREVAPAFYILLFGGRASLFGRGALSGALLFEAPTRASALRVSRELGPILGKGGGNGILGKKESLFLLLEAGIF